MIQPIWKDYVVTLGEAESVAFSLVVDGETIYTGKAYRKPGSASVRAKLNDIIADYLGRTRPEWSDGAFAEDAYTLEVSVQVGGTEIDSVTFCNDWSYDYGHDPERDGISAPINGRASSLAPLVVSVFDAESVRLNVTYKDGRSSFQIVSIAQLADFLATDFNVDFGIENLRQSGSGAVAFDISKWGEDVASVEVNGAVYNVQPCGTKVLYYVNAYGGWDTFLLEGASKRTDNLTRFERGMMYDNTDSANRGRDNYVNEIVRAVELHTGWLSDSESLRMHHLLNSPAVYLYDGGRIFPLVLTDNTTDYKTFKGEGRKLVHYTINAEIAQEFVRR